MLNITQNTVADQLRAHNLPSLNEVESRVSSKVLRRSLGIFFGILLVMMFVPWTQNIRSAGNMTTIHPDQRPQTIHSIIAGRIESWHVKEGDYVNKGDTIIRISEIKDEYFDPKLLERTQEQLTAKEMSVSSYMEKVKALDNQIDALVANGKLKLEQTKNKLKQAHLKVQSDSIKYEAAQTNYQIAQAQYDRMIEMEREGLKSLTDLEKRKLTLQKREAEIIEAENDLLTSKNELINAKVEINSIQAKFRDDISKAESDKYTAMSSMYDAEAVVTKLQNQFMNYTVRAGMYFITAPQDGYITKVIKAGLGETIKEGSAIVSIMPSRYDLAVQLYVKPLDLPLVKKGQHVRIQFDGWPAIVFSGWPNTSYGTYGGTVFAIDNFISDNGMYRLLVAPDTADHPWPDALRVGAGTRNFMLLQDVPIWYELWRQINGFPPDYYVDDMNLIGSDKSDSKEKK